MAYIAQSHRAPPPAPAGGTGSAPLRRLAFPALGTNCEIKYSAPKGEGQALSFERAVTAWVTGFEAKFSRFRSDSLVSRINAAAGREWVPVDEETEALFRLCDTLHFMTQGVLDPTTLPLLRLWDYRTENPRLPTDEEVDTARKKIGWKRVQRSPGKVFLPEPGMALDLGGFGKEYAVDIAAQIAIEQGITSALIDFGHDLRAVGTPPDRPAWHIGLEDPHKPGTTSGSIAVIGKGVASSGDYIRRLVVEGRRYGHIIDPRSGRPVANGCLQATVVTGSCLQAGALSTAAFVLGAAKGIEFIQSFPGAEGLIVTEHARAQTRGFFQHVVA